MKIMTILGTRPEIIRLSRVIPLLDDMCDHILVHTGQNFTDTLDRIFFDELRLRKPDYRFCCQSNSSMEQIASILQKSEEIIQREDPDRLLLLGDTNSALSAIAAKRMGILVYHMEAGNRCFDHRVPEEINRRIIDHCSDVNLPYTERSRQNLLREGMPSYRIFVTGNPIFEVMQYYQQDIEKSTILHTLGIAPGDYFLVTLHRAETVDSAERLVGCMGALQSLYEKYGITIICSLHPRTRSQLLKHNISIEKTGIIAIEPVGLFDFIKLEINARCVLSDSGTVQEECCILQIPNVTLRDVTERPETIEAGSCILAGCKSSSILAAVAVMMRHKGNWKPPAEYIREDVSRTVGNILLGKIPPP